MYIPQAGGSRQLVFVGNSLMNHSVGPGVLLYGYYIPFGVYASINATRHIAIATDAISGQTQTTINSNFPTSVMPNLCEGDIVVLWEITNDCGVNGATGQQAYDNIIAYRDMVVSCGCKLVVCTGIARDMAGDPADLLTRIFDCNTLIRNNSSEFYAVCDLAADAMFNQRADCSNGANYASDKVHLVQGGQDNVISLMSTTLSSLI